MHHPDAPVTALVFCGAPDDPATPADEQANVYATLTELNHFADPCVPFAAQYGLDGPRLSDEGSAFDNVYVLPHANRTPESRRDTLAHLGSYLFHELTTPLGLRLDASRLKRSQGDAVCFRSLGTYGIWFPRGLLLRLAAPSRLPAPAGTMAGPGQGRSPFGRRRRLCWRRPRRASWPTRSCSRTAWRGASPRRPPFPAKASRARR